MGLFRKKKKEVKQEKTNKIETTNSEISGEIIANKENLNNIINNEQIVSNENLQNKVEVLNLENKDKKLKTSIEKKKDINFLIILFGIVIVFVFALPTIKNIIVPKPKITINPDNKVESESGNLEHGYLVIGKDSYKKIDNIKFFDFKKYENNNLVFSYIADKNLNNTEDFNIYIEVIDKSGTFLHMEKFVVDKININAENSYSINLNSNIFKNSHYIKIEKNKPLNNTKTLVCKNGETSEITYNFKDKLLTSYIYNGSDINNNYEEEYNSLKNTNIKTEDINYKENSLYYKIDFSYFKSDKYITRYNFNDHYDGIKKYETEKGWTCE